MEKAAEHSRSAAPRRGFKNRLLMNVPRPGLYRLASASRERESKMLFHQRNNSSVATRTQVFRAHASLGAKARGKKPSLNGGSDGYPQHRSRRGQAAKGRTCWRF